MRRGFIVHYKPVAGLFVVNYHVVQFKKEEEVGRGDFWMNSKESVLALAELWFDLVWTGSIEIGICKDHHWKTRFSFEYFDFDFDEDGTQKEKGKIKTTFMQLLEKYLIVLSNSRVKK